MFEIKINTCQKIQKIINPNAEEILNDDKQSKGQINSINLNNPINSRKISNFLDEIVEINTNLENEKNVLVNQNDHYNHHNQNNLILDFDEDLQLYEVISGNLQIMRVKSENISLTDKYEFFRFLPIKRNNIILILAISESMNEEDFIQHIGNYLSKIKYIRFLYDHGGNCNKVTNKTNLTNNSNNLNFQNFMRAIIYFDNQDSADNFYYEYNDKSFPSNKFEFLYCVYIDKIYFDLNPQCNLSSINPNLVLLNPHKEQSELFCCPLCLEKLDTSSSGIHTIVNMVNVERWENYRKNCKVCRNVYLNSGSSSGFNNNNLINCFNCKSTENIWCCMICGFTGCDRYQLGHAVEHFNNTLHRYSIDLNSQRIWDYLGDGWVHRLIKIDQLNKNSYTNQNLNNSNSSNNITQNNNFTSISNNTNTIIIENENFSHPISENLNTKEFLMRIENIISEYNFVLSSQLEEQRKYYEKEISKINENVEHKRKNKLNIINSLKDEIAKKKTSIESNKKLYKECNKKLNMQERKIKDFEENINLNTELYENVKIDVEKQNVILEESSKNYENDVLKSKIKKKEELEKFLEDMYNTLSE